MPLSAPRLLLPATLLLTSILSSLPELVPPPLPKAIGSFTAPLDPLHQQSVITDAVVRDWHWPMMHDFDRNDQYEAGLVHAIQSLREVRRAEQQQTGRSPSAALPDAETGPDDTETALKRQ